MQRINLTRENVRDNVLYFFEGSYNWAIFFEKNRRYEMLCTRDAFHCIGNINYADFSYYLIPEEGEDFEFFNKEYNIYIKNKFYIDI